MDYFLNELSIIEAEKHTAGQKVREDMIDIFINNDLQEIQKVSLERKQQTGITNRIKIYINAIKGWKNLPLLNSGDTLIIQYPCIAVPIGAAARIKKIRKNNVNVILFVHDIDNLRSYKNSKVPIVVRLVGQMTEKHIFQSVSKYIVHNSKMKTVLAGLGFDASKIVELGIFDYLISDADNSLDKSKKGRNLPIIIAGSLKRYKAGYVYDLPNHIAFNLYGVEYEGKTNTMIRYYGSFEPDELPAVLEGSFGLVWDGDSAETCSGIYGEYMKINNPHKTSLYLAAGFPVIIWSQAALTDFILENKCGFAVNSLDEIADKIAALSDAEYEEMLENAARVGKMLRDGHYTKKAIEKAIKL